MSQPEGDGIDEVASAFARARDELAKVTAQLREFESLGEQRRSEQASIEAAGEQLREAIGSFSSLAERLDAAVGQVDEVLRAAQSALQSSEAGRLGERLSELGRGVNQQTASVSERLDTLQAEVSQLAVQLQTVADQDRTRQALHDENQHLHHQLNLVRSGLKPRQLETLGLDSSS